MGAMAGEKRVGLTRASGFILFWSATKARTQRCGSSQRLQHSIVPKHAASGTEVRSEAESDPVTLERGGVGIGLFPS